MVAQGSRRFTFSIDTVDESKNRSRGAKVHGNLQKIRPAPRKSHEPRHQRRIGKSISSVTLDRCKDAFRLVKVNYVYVVSILRRVGKIEGSITGFK